jgi:hypothetical protein
MSVIPALGKLRQEYLEFQARPCPKKKKNRKRKKERRKGKEGGGRGRKGIREEGNEKV